MFYYYDEQPINGNLDFVSLDVKGQDSDIPLEETKMKLNVKAFAFTCGIVWGVGLFLLTWWIIAFDGATGEPTFIGRLYRGFTISPAGSFIGLVWAFGDGLVGGAIFAWLYNLMCTRIWRSES